MSCSFLDVVYAGLKVQQSWKYSVLWLCIEPSKKACASIGQHELTSLICCGDAHLHLHQLADLPCYRLRLVSKLSIISKKVVDCWIFSLPKENSGRLLPTWDNVFHRQSISCLGAPILLVSQEGGQFTVK